MPLTATITIDRPDRRNALDVEACGRLASEFQAASRGGARAMVLTGAGRHFCAGADLALVHGTELSSALRHLLDVIVTVPVPVIAAVHGAALGAGTQLALACDLRVVDPTARFGIPAAKLGLMVDHWTVRRLARLAGPGPARAMLLAAEELDAESALRLGFAQRSGDLAAAQAWAEDLAALAPLTVAGHKLLLNQLEFGGPRWATDAHQQGDGHQHEAPSAPAAGPPLTGAVAVADAAAAAYARAWASADAIEGPAAFRERRSPRFEGR